MLEFDRPIYSSALWWIALYRMSARVSFVAFGLAIFFAAMLYDELICLGDLQKSLRNREDSWHWSKYVATERPPSWVSASSNCHSKTSVSFSLLDGILISHNHAMNCYRNLVSIFSTRTSTPPRRCLKKSYGPMMNRHRCDPNQALASL